jgi:hypothetical protein
MDVGQQCRSRVLKPIVGRDAFGCHMELESAVEVGQLRESGAAVARCGRCEVISRSEVAKELQEVPVERGGESEVSKPDLRRGGEVRRITLKQICERLVIQQVIHQWLCNSATPGTRTGSGHSSVWSGMLPRE